MKKVAAILGIIVSLTVIIGALYAYDKRVAKQRDLLMVEYRLNQKIVEDQRFYIQQKIWEIERQYGFDINKMPKDVAIRYKKLKFEIKCVEEKLKDKKGGP